MKPLLEPSPLDCVIIGPNTGHFAEYISARKEMDDFSGAYQDAQVNSLLIDNKRYSYLEWFNRIRKEGNPQENDVGTFDAPTMAELYLTSYLSGKGLRTAMAGEFQKNKRFLEELLGQEPVVAAITTTFCFEPHIVAEVTSFVRSISPKTRIVVGGPYISSFERTFDREIQNYVFGKMGADVYVIDGQGEFTLFRLISAIKESPVPDLTGIPNIVIQRNGQWLHTPREAENNHIGDHRIDWKLFKPDLIKPFTLTRTAISCPFHCSFCTYPVRAGEHRLADLDIVEKDFQQLDAIGVQFLDIIDDTFNVPLPRFKELCRMMIRNRFKFRWISYLRCGNLDEEAVALAAESGCTGTLLGIESGNQTVLQNMNKFSDPDKYRRGVRWLEEAGIMCWALMIVGFPGETPNTVRDSIRLIQDTAPSFFGVQMWYYDPTTPIHHRAGEFDLRGNGYGWHHRTMSWKEAASEVQAFIRSIDNSIYIPQTAFSFETIFYLVAQGVKLELIKDFLRLARRLVIDGFGDVPVDLNRYANDISHLTTGMRECARQRSGERNGVSKSASSFGV